MEKGIPLEDPGDYLLDPVLAEIKRRRKRTRAHLLGVPLIEGEQLEEPPRKRKEATPVPEVAPADQLLADVTLQFKPGKHNPSIIVSRPGIRHIEKKLPQAEYDILLKLARSMRASGRRRSITIKNWGWVDRGRRDDFGTAPLDPVATFVAQFRDWCFSGEVAQLAYQIPALPTAA